MTAPLYLYDDARARTFEPFALTRPASELRAGAEIIRVRWERAFDVAASGAVVARHLRDFEELDAPSAAVDELPAGAVLANARCVVALERVSADASLWSCDGRVAAVRLDRAVPVAALEDGSVPLEKVPRATGASVAIAGRWMDEVWHPLRDLNAQLAADIAAMSPRLTTARVDNCVIVGPHEVAVEEGATIEAHVYFDTTAGPVLVRRGAVVQAFTRLAGPCYVGPHSVVSSDRIGSCAIGDSCKVHGEVSSSIFLGHANKGHDGFVGHSYLGRWVNLGAGTTTSNLKNTYGSVTLWTPAGLRDTGLQFLGTLFGDHAKTGIGTRLTTGTVIGAGANVFGGAMPPKVVAPFAWGDGEPYQVYAVEKFLSVAEHVMSRRNVTFGERARRQLGEAHARRWSVSVPESA